MKKICNHCKREKDTAEFGKDKHGKDGFNPKCKSCCNKFQSLRKDEKKAYDAEYRIKNRIILRAKDKIRNEARSEERRSYKLTKKFGITAAEYDVKLAEQNHKCAICRKPEKVMVKGKIKRLAVDHRKEPFQVRGLLCNNCNRALGLLFENIRTMLRMIKYVLFWHKRLNLKRSE
jgi:hypothetical protein